jgi:hypothetical protein
LSAFGSRLYPETGDGGYASVHTNVFLDYDAATNLLLPGTHVVLTDQATQCLTDFSLDFERSSPNTRRGPDMTVDSVLVDGQPTRFSFVQPTYPGDPNGQNNPDPGAHEASQLDPVGGPNNNPLPPACAPELMSTNPNKQDSLDGTQCPANKLVITPPSPIPSGMRFVVQVAYTGRPGVHNNGDGPTEGWFSQAGDRGTFVTAEPVASEDWMPLNDHPSAKPTYDFYDTVPIAKTAIANGELISQTSNLPDANFLAARRAASFEEEMQTKITFAGGTIDLQTFNHENMHQWWGDNVSEANYNLTFFKEGLATLGEYLFLARNAQTAAGGPRTPAGDAAFENSLVSSFDTAYADTGSLWTAAPSNPRPYTLFSSATTYTRPGIAYIRCAGSSARRTWPRHCGRCNAPTGREESPRRSSRRASRRFCPIPRPRAARSSVISSPSGSTPPTRAAAERTDRRSPHPDWTEADSNATRRVPGSVSHQPSNAQELGSRARPTRDTPPTTVLRAFRS